MSWKDRAIGLHKRFGAPAKFAAKLILGAVLPGSPAVVELVCGVLDCAHETAKDNLDASKMPSASAADLQRVEQVLDVLNGDLAALMGELAKQEQVPDIARQILDKALATDEHCRQAAHRLNDLAVRFDRLEEQNRRLLAGQGFGNAMLAEMLPLMQRMVGVVDFVEELRAAGLGLADFSTRLREFQEAARALSAGRVAESGTRFASVAQAQPRSAAAATALAGAKAAGQDFLAAEQAIARAARLRPDDAELAELQRRVTVASRGATLREQSVTGAAWRQAPKVGDTLDGWRLDLLLGHGGWGRVFKASRGSEIRALKVMHPDLSRDPLFVERFKKEILTLASLRGHKNLIAIDTFGYAAEAGCWYFVMELIVGTSLERYLQKRGALSLQQARPLFLDLADGLAAAHARGIIHRDIKPANILIRRDGTPVLVDFGLAAVADDKRLTQTGRSAGYTAMFAAPEQLRGKPADARSDIYSLAASLYYALVYDKPEHREADRFEAKYVPDVLRELLTTALHQKPECRPPSVAAFCELLPSLSPAGRRGYLKLAGMVLILLVALPVEPTARQPIKFDNTATRYIQQSETPSSQALQKLAKANIRIPLPDTPQSGTGKGRGSGGGSGDGRGTGAGNGRGEGRGTLTKREKRMLRWSMLFDTRNGRDYLDQLKGLGAILAIPDDAGGKNYKLIRDLSARPAKLLDEDISKIQRIYWIDDKPDSVRDVMEILGVPRQLSHFVAFVPEKLEQKLFELENAYREKYYSGRTEADILETKFQINRSDTGYEPAMREEHGRPGSAMKVRR